MAKGKKCLVCIILAAFAMLLAIGQLNECFAKKKTGITIAGAGVGGVWYSISGGMAELINENLPDLTASSQATGASVENLRLLQAKSVEFGMYDRATGYKSVIGQEPFKTPVRNVREVWPMFLPVFQVIIKKKHGVTSYPALIRKKIAGGALGSGTWASAIVIFPEFGCDRKDLVPLGYRVANDAFKDDRIDAIFQYGGYPFPNLSELATIFDTVFISMTGREQNHIVTKFPQYVKHTIPAGIYKGQDKPLVTVGSTAIFCAREDIPEDLVYNITKLYCSEKGLQYLGKVHSVLKSATKEKALDWALSPRVNRLHPGAAKYYKELAAELGRKWEPERIVD